MNYDKLKSDLSEQKSLFEDMENDLEKFSTGNQSAGTRLRGNQQKLKKLAQSIRNGVTEIKNQA